MEALPRHTIAIEAALKAPREPAAAPCVARAATLGIEPLLQSSAALLSPPSGGGIWRAVGRFG